MSENWKWIIELDPMVGQYCNIETLDGSYREGKITRVITRNLRVEETEKRAVPLPIGVELNGDSSDVINFAQMKVLGLR